MAIAITENTSTAAWHESGWTLRSFNTLDVAIAPPVVVVDIADFAQPDTKRFLLVHRTRTRSIDAETHESLLQRSLREYSEIWKTLAEK